MFNFIRKIFSKEVPEVPEAPVSDEVKAAWDLADKQVSWLCQANEEQRERILSLLNHKELDILLDATGIESGLWNILVFYYEKKKPPVEGVFPRDTNLEGIVGV